MSVTYRTTIQQMGFSGGRDVTVTIGLDDTPEETAIPGDLAAALGASPEAEASFDALASSYRENVIDQITSARRSTTRERRIATTIQKLQAGQKR